MRFCNPKRQFTYRVFFFVGLLSWDVNDCLVDLEKELAIITEQGLEGEEARHGKFSSYIQEIANLSLVFCKEAIAAEFPFTKCINVKL